MDYDLTRLGPDAFERLIISLAQEIINKRVKGFRAGPYGGREGTFGETVITWPRNLGGGIWDSLAAVNIQFKGRSAGVRADTQWFHECTKTHLSGWQAGRRQGVIKRTARPYTLFITNAEIIEVPGQGLQEINDMIQGYSEELSINGWKIWHYRTICTLLDDAPRTRKHFAGYIFPDDFLFRVNDFNLGVSPIMIDSIKRQVIGDLAADQWVRLSRVGTAANDKLSLGSVGVDLPLVSESSNAINYILDIGDRIRRPEPFKAPLNELAGQPVELIPNIMLVGGPGQGKTTIGQLVCQAYRVALLPSKLDLRSETARLLDSHREGLRRINVHLPRYRRWPLRIDLSNYGDAASSTDRVPLVKYIAAKMSTRISSKVDSSHIRRWLQIWPWVLVLDGLDEVASAKSRDLLMEKLQDFTIDAELADADVFILATTRPQGYADEFAKEKYRHISLAPLTPNQAIAYAGRLAEVRHVGDPDMRDRVIARTRSAAAEQFAARLMRTPLQVTIMSILLEARERAPQARYALFDAYYDAVYSREVSKPGPMAELLEARKNDIHILHDRIGLLLQAKAEQTGEADASISRGVLHELSLERLQKEGYREDDARELADSIISAVTRRLVLIVPKALDDIGFEVRSIQEFMASRAIVSGPDDSVLQRLKVISPSIHWRNTWLFSAGRIFSEREHLRRPLVGLLEDSDTSNLLNMLVAPGADLALDLLDDDVAAAAPSMERALTKHAFSLLNYSPDQDLIRRAETLLRMANRDSVIRATAEQILDQCLTGSPAQRKSAEAVLTVWKGNRGPLALRARQVTNQGNLVARKSMLSDPPDTEIKNIGDLLSGIKKPQNLTTDDLLTIDLLISQLRSVRILPYGAPIDSGTRLLRESTETRAILSRAVSQPAVAEFLADAALKIAKETWNGSAYIRDFLRSWLQRQGVAENLMSITPFLADG